jgi:hypothetical protein
MIKSKLFLFCMATLYVSAIVNHGEKPNHKARIGHAASGMFTPEYECDEKNCRIKRWQSLG